MKKIIISLFVIVVIGTFTACSNIQVKPAAIEKHVVKIATAAAVIYASHNKSEVAVILPYVKDALSIAREGKITVDNLAELATRLTASTDNEDVKTALALLAVEFQGMAVTGDAVNADAVAALEAIVTGLDVGSKQPGDQHEKRIFKIEP
jgi:hypothetical protein